jgi:hypothetical protein
MSPQARNELLRIARTFAANGFNTRLAYQYGQHSDELIRLGMLKFQAKACVLTPIGIVWCTENYESE